MTSDNSVPGSGLHLCLVSIHGLVRGSELELGRDADTGGQTLYVLELAKALAKQPDVRQVDLVTRLIEAETVATDYAQPVESLAPGVQIIRVPCGGSGYLAKEQLWEHIDVFADNLIAHYQMGDNLPDIVHSHYADAGFVGSRVSHVLGVPLVHTGHSLGRVKRRRLLATGLDSAAIELRYNMTRRIEAEEMTLASAVRVITSTHQEIEEQYEQYDFYQPEAMRVIPPGTDLSRFQPPQGGEHETPIAAAVHRFLREPDKPMVLALSRADARKNIAALLHAYGQDAALQERANLVIIVGNREDLTDLEDGARDVLTELLQLIDRYDLYGKVAYPKHHRPDDVPVIYRLATLSGGVFVNPALTEPFGLTLIEAAASGLPIVATEDGGPRDIVAHCQNGVLIDPLETRSISEAIMAVIGDWERWQRLSVSGLQGVREHYVWDAHAAQYLDMIKPIAERREKPPSAPPARVRASLYSDRALFTDLNRSLLGGDEADLVRLVERIRSARKQLLFGIITGLRLDAALRLLKKHHIPEPDFLVTSNGTSITYAPKLTEDTAWARHIEKQWTPQVVRRVLSDVAGLTLREKDQQSEFKVSYRYDADTAPHIDEINAILFQEDQAVNVTFSHGQYLNVVPIRASKGLALRYLAAQWNMPLERVLAIGGSGADEGMMRGNTLAAVVGNRAHEELSQLEEGAQIYVTKASHAAGVLEAMDYYDFLGTCQAPAMNEEVKQASNTPAGERV